MQVKCCPVCQRMNSVKLQVERPALNPVPVKSTLSKIGMDFVGPISPVLQNGNSYIFYYFSKFGWAKVLSSKEAAVVVSAMREVCLIQAFYKYRDI